MKKETVVDVTPDEKPPEAPAPDNDPAPTTSIVGNGADGFNMKAGNGGGTGSGQIGGRGGSALKWYLSNVKKNVESAARNSKKLRTANLGGTLRLWLDDTGRVTRATLSGASGDAEAQTALTDELKGLTLADAPPKEIEMPIIMRFSASKPGSVAAR